MVKNKQAMIKRCNQQLHHYHMKKWHQKYCWIAELLTFLSWWQTCYCWCGGKTTTAAALQIQSKKRWWAHFIPGILSAWTKEDKLPQMQAIPIEHNNSTKRVVPFFRSWTIFPQKSMCFWGWSLFLKAVNTQVGLMVDAENWLRNYPWTYWKYVNMPC